MEITVEYQHQEERRIIELSGVTYIEREDSEVGDGETNLIVWFSDPPKVYEDASFKMYRNGRILEAVSDGVDLASSNDREAELENLRQRFQELRDERQ